MNCLVCLEASATDYHPRCARLLFGSSEIPSLELELGKLHTFALAMIGHTSLSGVQRKVSLSLSSEPRRLFVAAAGGTFILKPQSGTFPSLPENEHLSLRLARLAKIRTATAGLVRLKDRSLALLVVRFDRRDGRKLHQEDFCQLAVQPPKEKYAGSAEACARILRRHASAPRLELLELFRRMLFTWWTGNGDMHLKNFSLLREPDGVWRLSPAYDLLSTRLVIPEDPLALPLGGKRDQLTRRSWREFAAYCEVPPRAAERVRRELVSHAPRAHALIARSHLPEEFKDDYASLLRERTASLGHAFDS